MRQERILEGALEVFRTRGLEASTMDEIARTAGFGKATLYYYFSSKEEVFCHILEQGWRSLWEGLEPVMAMELSPRKTFVKVLSRIAEAIGTNPNLYEFLFDAPKTITHTDPKHQIWKKYQTRLYTYLKHLLDDGIKAGEFPDMDQQLMFKAIGGLFVGSVFMGNRKTLVSEQEMEKLLTNLISNPAQG